LGKHDTGHATINIITMQKQIKKHIYNSTEDH